MPVGNTSLHVGRIISGLDVIQLDFGQRSIGEAGPRYCGWLMLRVDQVLSIKTWLCWLRVQGGTRKFCFFIVVLVIFVIRMAAAFGVSTPSFLYLLLPLSFSLRCCIQVSATFLL
jgi:hypothetical protein